MSQSMCCLRIREKSIPSNPKTEDVKLRGNELNSFKNRDNRGYNGMAKRKQFIIAGIVFVIGTCLARWELNAPHEPSMTIPILVLLAFAIGGSLGFVVAEIIMSFWN